MDTKREDTFPEAETNSSNYVSVSGLSTRSSLLSVRGTDHYETYTDNDLLTAVTEASSEDASTTIGDLCLEDNLTGYSTGENKLVENGKTLCFNCTVDGKQTNATHFCKSCKPGRRYICHKCLQGHNRWSDDHFVVSLSAHEESSVRSGKEINKDSSDTEHIPNTKNENISSIPYLKLREKDKTHFVEQKLVRSGYMDHPKIEMLRGCFRYQEKDPERAQKTNKPRFYDDKLYHEILQDPSYKHPSQTTRERFVKYGTYAVHTNSDTKPCFVTGTCQLQDGRIVITDSENCKLKMLDPNSFKVIASHKLQSNPCLISSMKEKKVAVAFANCEVAIVHISEDIEFRNSFILKHVCKSMTYGNGNLYVCTARIIEIYNETGDRKTSIQPTSRNYKIKCLTSINISKNGDIIYVSDLEKGIVVMDEEGHILNIISDNIYEPNVLCLDVSGKLFATEMNSGRVLKVDPDNGNVTQVVREVCQKDYPISLCHERIFNRLIVGVWRSDSIHVFTCQ